MAAAGETKEVIGQYPAGPRVNKQPRDEGQVIASQEGS
jgi:hypothetical protein